MGNAVQTTQLSLELETLPINLVHDIKYADEVKQNYKFTFSRREKVSLLTERILLLLIAQVATENSVREIYQIKIADLIKLSKLSDAKTVYKKMPQVVEELASVVFYEKEFDKYIPRHLLDTTRRINPAGYHHGILTISFNPVLHEYILDTAHHSKYKMADGLLSFSSWFSLRLWVLLSAFHDTGWWKVPIEDYRDYMGCWKKENKNVKGKYVPVYELYPNTTDLITNTTDVALKEFSNTPLDFTTDMEYGVDSDGVRRITHVVFNLKKKKLTPQQTVNQWCLKSDPFKAAVIRLRKYEVSDENIVKYSRILGAIKTNELLHEWDIKNLTDSTRIKSPKSFCNKVYVQEALAITAKLNKV